MITPRRRLAALVLAAAVAFVAGIVVGAGGGDDSEPPESRAPGPSVHELPLERAVGQLLMMSFDGSEVPEYIRRRLRRGEGAGVILFGPNAPRARLSRVLQRAARGTALIAIDQEGGSIRNLPSAPPERSQAAVTSTADAQADAAAAAKGLHAAGININLAPVADVAQPGSVVASRAYPTDVPATVRAALSGYSANGVAATVKHFPGLGRAGVNTDDGAVTIDAARDDLERVDLEPFRAAIAAGVPLVMAGHAIYPAFDDRHIASQSPLLLDHVLRGELGFDGVVVTDSIEAQAVLVRSDVATAAERSVAAGADLILMTGSGSWNEIYPRLLARARGSASFRARVREAARRVLALERRLGLGR